MEKSNKSRRLKYGAFSTATIIFAVACLVIINMIFSGINITWDMTPDNFYTISDKTEEILNALDEEITIYTLFKTGEEVPMYRQLINEYSKFSNIKIVDLDFYQNGPFIQSYAGQGQTIPVNSMIVESPRRSKVVLASDLFTTSYDSYAMSEVVSTIEFEPQITNAIRYVTAEKVYNVYELIGHGEMLLSENYRKYVTDAGFNLKEVNVYADAAVPEDCAILLVGPPQVDWTSQEAQVVRDYLEKGGRAIFFIDYTGTEFPNLKGVLNSYGVDYGENIILESDPKYLIPVSGSYNPFYSVPILNSHQITNPTINEGRTVLMPQARPLSILDVKRGSITVEPLLVSSPGAYMKASWEDYASINPEPGDTMGPFDLIYAVSENFTGEFRGPVTKFVVAGTSALIVDDFNNGTNSSLFINMLNWLQDEKETVYIPGKKVTNSALTFSNYNEMLVIFAVAFIAIPGTILVAGAVVYFRRRNR